MNPTIEFSQYISLRVSAGVEDVVHLAKGHWLLTDQELTEWLIFTPRTLIFD